MVESQWSGISWHPDKPAESQQTPSTNCDGAIGASDGKVLVAGIDPIPEDRLPFNLRATVTPCVLVQSKTSNAVRESIAWAKRHGIPLCGRGGGHSYEGFSSIAGLVIDVGDMNSIAVDAVHLRTSCPQRLCSEFHPCRPKHRGYFCEGAGVCSGV